LARGIFVIAGTACGGVVGNDGSSEGTGGTRPALDAAAGGSSAHAGAAGTGVIRLPDASEPEIGFPSCPAQQDIPLEKTDAGACEVTFQPLGAGRRFNPSYVNIEIETAEGRRIIYNVADDSGCDGLKEAGLDLGWFYIDTREPARAGFCPETCAIIEAEALGTVNILFGCPTRP
jgi:hypothetical protein